jgi:hypothetical protein
MASSKSVVVTKVGYARPIALALSRPALAGSALRLAFEAVRSFFLPQFANMVFHRRPVVNVDHPLDAEVPFDPHYVKKYLEFVELWIGSFYSIWKLYGDAAIPGLVGYIDAIRGLYSDAGSIYWKVHTTTTRPARNYNMHFALIHATDPHLNCIPSLHVLIVVANWLLVEDLVEQLGDPVPVPHPGFDASAWIEHLRAEAVAITESILFVKQHSVNCIGVSLYYLKRRFPRFDSSRVGTFVRDLFAEGCDALEDKDALRARILEICDLLELFYTERAEGEWRSPILDFIGSCARR